MNRQDECQELCALLRSRFPIILIQSHEEPRVLELLQKAANLENQVLMTWSITNGIRRHGRDEAIYQTNDLLDALKHIDKTAAEWHLRAVRCASGVQGSGRDAADARDRPVALPERTHAGLPESAPRRDAVGTAAAVGAFSSATAESGRHPRRWSPRKRGATSRSPARSRAATSRRSRC